MLPMWLILDFYWMALVEVLAAAVVLQSMSQAVFCGCNRILVRRKF